MIYTAIDTFYVTDDQLKNSPSRKDNIDEETEMILRLYGCDLIQESGILLRLPQAVMATGQVLFHRFYCKKSFSRFNVKKVAASCVWLASKLEESPRKAKHIFLVFHRMECRRENRPLEHFDFFSKKYTDLKMELTRTERHLLKEMGFICHVEHPHKFIPSYLKTLEAPQELRQEAWNLANDSLRTTLCVRFKGEVVACGVVYAAARRFQLPLPENPAWWTIFGADKTDIDEVCKVLAHLYSLPKAQYIHVSKDSDSFTLTSKTRDAQTSDPKAMPNGNNTPVQSGTPNTDTIVRKDSAKPSSVENSKESGKAEDSVSAAAPKGVDEEEDIGKTKIYNQRMDASKRMDVDGDKGKEKERSRARDRERDRDYDRERGRDSDREREREKETERDRDNKLRERNHHRSREKGKDSGHSEKSRHHSSRDRGEYHSYTSSREKDRHRHHSYS